MKKSQFCSIADLLFSQHAVITEEKSFCQPGKFPFSHFGNRKDHVVGINLSYPHVVFRKGACFIGTHNPDRSQGFHCRQFPDNGVHLHHTPYSQGQHYSHHSRQALRYGRYSQRNRQKEHLEHIPVLEQPQHK